MEKINFNYKLNELNKIANSFEQTLESTVKCMTRYNEEEDCFSLNAVRFDFDLNHDEFVYITGKVIRDFRQSENFPEKDNVKIDIVDNSLIVTLECRKIKEYFKQKIDIDGTNYEVTICDDRKKDNIINVTVKKDDGEFCPVTQTIQFDKG